MNTMCCALYNIDDSDRRLMMIHDDHNSNTASVVQLICIHATCSIICFAKVKWGNSVKTYFVGA